MDQKAQSILGYPSVRRVVDSIFGVSEEPLSFLDALSGSFALALLAFFFYVAARQLLLSWRLKRRKVKQPNVVRRKSARRSAVAANDAGPHRPTLAPKKPTRR